MPGKNDLPPQEELQDDAYSSLLKKWLTKEQAMEFLNVKRTLYNNYKKIYGLKTSIIGGRERVRVDDLNDFLMQYRQ